jgi:diphosphomevalonate decarboxylase
MEKHPFAERRYAQGRQNLNELRKALSENDVNNFIRITENEALTLHGLMMSSDPGYLLLEPASLEILTRIRRFRESTGIFVTFTIDAGPNVHVLCPGSEAEAVNRKLTSLINIKSILKCKPGGPAWLLEPEISGV